MAGKPWEMKLEVSKVLADGGLAICSLAARGAWMWLLMRMHADGATGVWEGTTRQFALLVGAVDEPVADIIRELRDARVGDFEDLDGGRIRITSRRIKREAETREKDRERKSEPKSISEPIPDHFQTNSEAFSDYDYKNDLEKAERKKKDAHAHEAWQIAMYHEATGRAPALAYWPAITATVVRKDVWQIALDRAESEAWKASNVNARLDEYKATERTMYPTVKGQPQNAPPKPRSATCDACGKPTGVDGGNYQGRAYCGPCFDAAAWLNNK